MQEGEIKSFLCQPTFIEFALSYIAEKDGDKFSLDPQKVNKFAGLALLAAKGDF